MLNEEKKKKLDKRLETLQKKYDLKFELYTQEQYTGRSTQTPSGKILEYQFTREGEKVAHVGLIPVELCNNKKKLLGVLAAGTWVSPKYRGEGLFSALMWRSIQELQLGPYQFYCGFPNRSAYPIWTHSLGAEHPTTLHFMVKPNKLDQLLQKANVRLPYFLVSLGQSFVNLWKAWHRRKIDDLSVIEISKGFPEEVDELLSKRENPGVIYFSKNLERLRWQYGDTKFIKFLSWGSNGELNGYLVASIDLKEGVHVAAILDFEVNSTDIFASLVLAFENHFAKATLFSILSLPHHQEYRTVKKMGYRKLPTDKYGRSFWFIFYPFRREAFNNINFDQWYLTFYDTIDIF